VSLLAALVIGAVVGALVGALTAALTAWKLLEFGFRKARHDCETIATQASADMKLALETMDDLTARASRERARIEQAEKRATGARPSNAPRRPYHDAQGYKRHLQRNGARDFAFEAELGWTTTKNEEQAH